MDSIKRYLHFVKPYRMQIIGTIIIGIIKFAIPLLIPLLLKFVVDDIINATDLDKQERITSLLKMMGIMLVIFVIIRPPVEYYRQYFAQWTSNKILYDIRDQLFAHLQTLSL